jgi:hypothetical protein
MSDIVNLRQARKQKARHAKEVVAEAHRAEHGIAKSTHNRAKAAAEKDTSKLEGHRLDED